MDGIQRFSLRRIYYYVTDSLFSFCSLFFSWMREIELPVSFMQEVHPLLFPLLILFIMVSILSYLYLRYPFWCRQPCYHPYDFWRWGHTKPFVIQTGKPRQTKYCDFLHVKTFVYVEMGDREKREAVECLQNHFLLSDSSLFFIQTKDLDVVLLGHSIPALLSLYYETVYLSDLSGGGVLQKNLPIGCVTSRPIWLRFHTTSSRETASEPSVSVTLFYWDFLCIHREKVSDPVYYRTLLQTHEYNARALEPSVLGSFFKKEAPLLEGIVPTVEYRSTSYVLANCFLSPLDQGFSIERIYKVNESLLLLDFLYEVALFPFMGLPCKAVLHEMILKDVLYVYCLKQGEARVAWYFFKEGWVEHEVMGCTLELVGSVAMTGSRDMFVKGFAAGLREILQYSDKKYRILKIDSLSHNGWIDEALGRMFSPVVQTSVALYFYNYVVPFSIREVDTFVLL